MKTRSTLVDVALNNPTQTKRWNHNQTHWENQPINRQVEAMTWRSVGIISGDNSRGKSLSSMICLRRLFDFGASLPTLLGIPRQ